MIKKLKPLTNKAYLETYKTMPNYIIYHTAIDYLYMDGILDKKHLQLAEALYTATKDYTLKEGYRKDLEKILKELREKVK